MKMCDDMKKRKTLQDCNERKRENVNV